MCTWTRSVMIPKRETGIGQDYFPTAKAGPLTIRARAVGRGRSRRPTSPQLSEGAQVKPLQDLRIIAVEQYGAGPWGSVHLADLGADVIKIEDPSVGGDVGRYVPPYAAGEDSLFFEVFNRGKRSLSLDLGDESGRAVFEDLVRGADAVWSNLRGDVPAKIKIRYDDLKELNPRIVCCSLTGFGMTGPRRQEPGYDYILQGLAGWMEVTGEPDGPPTKSGLSMVDYSGGFIAAISLLSGIHAARRDGVGMDCDVSLYDTAIAMLNYPGTWALNTDFVPSRPRHSAHPSLVPFQAFPDQGLLDHRGVPEGEVLAAPGAGGRAPGVGRGPSVRDVRGAGGEQGHPAAGAGADLRDPHLGAVAGRALPGRDPVRADQHGARVLRGGAHRGPGADRHHRAPALGAGAPAAHRGQRRAGAYRLPARAAAQRGLRARVRELLSYDDDRIAALVDSGAFGDADTTPYLPKA